MTKENKIEIIKLENVRLSYPSLFKPSSFQDTKEPKYQAVFMLNKITHAATIKKITEVRDTLLTGLGFKNLSLLDNKYILLRDGDTRLNQQGELIEEYKGHFTISASNKNRIQILNKDGKTPILEEDGLIYGGCYVNAAISIWTYDNKFGKGVAANLHAVQYVSKGEPFGTTVNLEGIFTPIEDEFSDII